MKHFLFALPAACLLLFSCKNESKPAEAATGDAFTVKYEEYHSKKCVRDTVCVAVDIIYPVLQGGNQSAVLQSINDSTNALIGMLIGMENPRPVPAGFDSAAIELYNMLDEQVRSMTDMVPDGYALEITGKASWQTARYLSYQIGSYSYAGGAHPNSYLALMTYDLTTGKALTLPQIIADTTALRPLLEAGMLEAKKEFDPEITLKEMLFEPDQPLAFPQNFAVTAEGVHFYYNPYEVAAYAYGPTDIMLSWEKLGKLADRSKWVQ